MISRLEQELVTGDALQRELDRLRAEIEHYRQGQAQDKVALDELRAENDTLRALLGNSAKDCAYCGLPAIEQARCKHGFPGCPRSDDQQLSKHFADGAAVEQLYQENERLQQELAFEKESYSEFKNNISAAYRVAVERATAAEAALAEIGRVPDVADRAGVGDGSVRDAVIALTGALATARKDALEDSKREIGWVIVRDLPDGLGYFDGSGRFSLNNLDAIRFARREDAERYLELLHGASAHPDRVEEHIWL